MSRFRTGAQAVLASIRFENGAELTDVDDGTTRGANPHGLGRHHSQSQTQAPAFPAAPDTNQQYGGGAPGAHNSYPYPSSNQGGGYSRYDGQQNAGTGYANATQYPTSSQPNQPHHYQAQQWNPSQQYQQFNDGQVPQYTHQQSQSPVGGGSPIQQNTSNQAYTYGPILENQSPEGRWQYDQNNPSSQTGGYTGRNGPPAHVPRSEWGIGRTGTYGDPRFERQYSPDALSRAYTMPSNQRYNPEGRDDVRNNAGSRAARRSRDGLHGFSSDESIPSGYGSENYGRGSAESQSTERRDGEICYHCSWTIDRGRCGCS